MLVDLLRPEVVCAEGQQTCSDYVRASQRHCRNRHEDESGRGQRIYDGSISSYRSCAESNRVAQSSRILIGGLHGNSTRRFKSES